MEISANKIWERGRKKKRRKGKGGEQRKRERGSRGGEETEFFTASATELMFGRRQYA